MNQSRAIVESLTMEAILLQLTLAFREGKMCTKYEHIPVVRIKNGRLWNDVKFSLTYDGELLSASDKHNRVQNKNQIRFDLASQIWPIYCAGDFSRFQLDHNTIVQSGVDFYGIGFFPLLTRKMNASCSLAIRFMRNDRLGDIVHGGDLDNRLKTLFDALRLPEQDNEVLPKLYPSELSDNDVKLCGCLLEDDSLITDLTVNTVTIMRPQPKNHVRLVIDVEFRPFDFV